MNSQGPSAGSQPEATADVLRTSQQSPSLSRLLAASCKPGSLGRLAHYEVLEVLGSGGFGIVLKAFDEKLHRLVALKLLGENLARDAGARVRFVREARAAAAVNNEHVVSVYAVEEQPVPYLVMEYVAGPTLQERFNDGRALPLQDVLQIGYQIASGLAAAHRNGLIHRDIKPGNILLETQDDLLNPNEGSVASAIKAKITDFGLARTIDDGPGLAQSGVIVGTPQFMSPEQALDEPVDQRSDLYSLGSVLYAMCTGTSPFDAPSSLAVMKRVCDEQPAPVATANPAVPRWLSDAIGRLLAKKPADRFGSAAEVAELFARALSRPRGPATMELSPQRPNLISSQRHILRSAAIVGVMVLMVAGMAIYFVRQREHTEGNGTTTNNAEPEKLVDELPSDFEAWMKTVAALSPQKQAEAVAIRLRDHNPGFDGKFTRKIEASTVKEFSIVTDHVKDIAPVRALAHLDRLDCPGTFAGNRALEDLTPLRGMKIRHLHFHYSRVKDLSPLEDLALITLNCGHSQVADLSPLRKMKLQSLFATEVLVSDLTPLKDMPLIQLDCSQTRVSSLEPVANAPLTWLKCSQTPINDLSPLKGKAITVLWCAATKVTDLSPLLGAPLQDLRFDIVPQRDHAILQTFPKLTTINGRPAKDWMTAKGK